MPFYGYSKSGFYLSTSLHSNRLWTNTSNSFSNYTKKRLNTLLESKSISHLDISTTLSLILNLPLPFKSPGLGVPSLFSYLPHTDSSISANLSSVLFDWALHSVQSSSNILRLLSHISRHFYSVSQSIEANSGSDGLNGFIERNAKLKRNIGSLLLKEKDLQEYEQIWNERKVANQYFDLREGTQRYNETEWNMKEAAWTRFANDAIILIDKSYCLRNEALQVLKSVIKYDARQYGFGMFFTFIVVIVFAFFLYQYATWRAASRPIMFPNTPFSNTWISFIFLFILLIAGLILNSLLVILILFAAFISIFFIISIIHNIVRYHNLTSVNILPPKKQTALFFLFIVIVLIQLIFLSWFLQYQSILENPIEN